MITNSEYWLNQSPVFEKIGYITFFLFFVILIFLKKKNDLQTNAKISRRTELIWLVAILVYGTFLRLFNYHLFIPGSDFSGQIPVLRTDAFLQYGNIFKYWWHQLQTPNSSGFLYDSPLIQPIIAGFEIVFGTSIYTFAWVGTFFGFVTILLAWWTGRILSSPQFGLVFAAVLTASPFQLAWDRIGYRVIATSPHILLVLCVTAIMVQTRRFWLIPILSFLSYLSVYNYELARLAIPIAAIAIIFVPTNSFTLSIKKRMFLSTAYLFSVILWGAMISSGTLMQTFWPPNPGAVAIYPNESIKDALIKKFTFLVGQSYQYLDSYFFANRTGIQSGFQWGTQFGGVSFLSLLLIGLVGIAVLLKEKSYKKINLIWFSIFAIGLLAPSLSCMSSRRLVVLNLAWSGFVATGIIFIKNRLVDLRLGQKLSAAVVVIFLGLVGGWSLASMWMLRATSEMSGIRPIAYAYGCVGDIRTCPRAIEASRSWLQDLKNNNMIVLVDSDIDRENPTSPAGLPMYGYLAAAELNRRSLFHEFYSWTLNYTYYPIFRTFYNRESNFEEYISKILTSKNHHNIIWHFERPTAWERWFASELTNLGGSEKQFKSSLSSNGGLQIITEPNDIPRIVDFISKLRPKNLESCIRIIPTEIVGTSHPPTNFIRKIDISGQKPFWAQGDNIGLWLNEKLVNISFPRDLIIQDNAIQVIDQWGRMTQLNPFELDKPKLESSFYSDVRPFCTAYVGDSWWTIDAETGILSGNDIPSELNDGKWMGIHVERNRIYLASADQKVFVFDLKKRKMMFQKKLPVMPMLRFTYRECTPIVRGNNWTGTFDIVSNQLFISNDHNSAITTMNFNKLGYPNVAAVSVIDQELGLAFGNGRFQVFQIDESRCETDKKDNLD